MECSRGLRRSLNVELQVAPKGKLCIGASGKIANTQVFYLGGISVDRFDDVFKRVDYGVGRSAGFAGIDYKSDFIGFGLHLLLKEVGGPDCVD